MALTTVTAPPTTKPRFSRCVLTSCFPLIFLIMFSSPVPANVSGISCRAPKIYSYLLWGLVLYWLLRPFTFVSPLSFMGACSKTDGALAHAKPCCQGNCAGGSCRGGQQAAGRQRGSDRFFQDGRREREGENDTALRGGRDLDCTGCEVKMCGACETIYRETVRGSSRLEAPSYILLCVNQ